MAFAICACARGRPEPDIAAAFAAYIQRTLTGAVEPVIGLPKWS